VAQHTAGIAGSTPRQSLLQHFNNARFFATLRSRLTVTPDSSTLYYARDSLLGRSQLATEVRSATSVFTRSKNRRLLSTKTDRLSNLRAATRHRVASGSQRARTRLRSQQNRTTRQRTSQYYTNTTILIIIAN